MPFEADAFQNDSFQVTEAEKQEGSGASVSNISF